jgi:tRNA threonylcarbamoyladenosine modification (KEOPS) complex  Pcc1 subunit
MQVAVTHKLLSLGLKLNVLQHEFKESLLKKVKNNFQAFKLLGCYSMHKDHENWVINCTLSLKFDTPKDATIFYRSYIPEHGTIPRKRSQVSLLQAEDEIKFTIQAKDITAFRATMNSILQFGNIVLKVVKKVDSLK